MKITAGQRDLGKMYRRRDRYEIPDWQRGEVWDKAKKQQLVDSILRGWKLPKFYFVKNAEDEFEVLDGQQRLSTIYEFIGNEFPLSPRSAKNFGGALYKDLPQRIADAFDDFVIEYDEIEDAADEELKDFFQRLQQGLPLTSSEKLNAVHSKLRDYCRKLASHPFLADKTTIPNTRYAHFDIIAKAAALEIEGLDAGLRFDDLKEVFGAQAEFSPKSAIAKRLKAALDLLVNTFPTRSSHLKSRTVAQSLITLSCRLVATERATGMESALREFVQKFAKQLAEQVELGQVATDADYIRFQRSVNANVKTGARIRHEILVRKLFLLAPQIADAFDAPAIRESGITTRVRELGESIGHLIELINKSYAAQNGEDLFKATTRTTRALLSIGRAVTDVASYETMVDNLYFLFRESIGERLNGTHAPTSFADVNLLRTDIRHDVDHGPARKVRSKRKKIGATFAKYAGKGTPDTVAPETLVITQAGLLTAIETDLKALAAGMPQPNAAAGGATRRS